jgi:hypothetical protein
MQTRLAAGRAAAERLRIDSKQNSAVYALGAVEVTAAAAAAAFALIDSQLIIDLKRATVAFSQ